MRLLVILAIALSAVAGTVSAAPTGFPSAVALPDAVKTKGDVKTENYGQVEFTVRDKTEVVRGKKWIGFVQMSGFAADDRRYLDVLADAMEKAGWEVLLRDVPRNPPLVTLRRTVDKKEIWVSLEGLPGEAALAVVERGAPAASLQLDAPMSGIERVSANADFPLLKRFPGSQLRQTTRDERPLLVVFESGKDPVQVASSMVAKEYRTLPGTGPLEIVVVYRDALKAAGWQIVEENTGVAIVDPNLTARYVKPPLELWVHVHATDGYTLAVADAGAERAAPKLKAELDRTCKAAIYGVFFDFDKPTLRADAEPALGAIQKLLHDYPDLKIELAGFDDGAGARDHNLKLAEARVNAVRGWLVGKGVTAERLPARGNPEAQPLDASDSPAVRARNRRLELRKLDCRM
jgi:outer membrane protein OmpA-like peptidoglycan-associated protein